MRVEVLGCSGGIGKGLRTTSLLLGESVLIDAGTGLGDLSQAQLTQIRHVFITHSHLDHIACLPFLLDNLVGRTDIKVMVYALAETVAALKTHIFNWKIWPDFTQIPDAITPLMAYTEVAVGQKITLNNFSVTVLPANHVVPAVGYEVRAGAQALVFTGDTTASDALIEALNNLPDIKYLIIETAFADKESDLAKITKHFSPKLLAEELSKLKHHPEIFVTHFKPDEDDVIMREIHSHNINRPIAALTHQQVFEL